MSRCVFFFVHLSFQLQTLKRHSHFLFSLVKQFKTYMEKMQLLLTCIYTPLKECILDFGPVYGFWLFSFERYNGILGGYHTKQKSIEIQVMRRFLSDMSIRYTAVAGPVVQEHIDLFVGILDGKV